MKLLSFLLEGEENYGLYVDGNVFSLRSSAEILNIKTFPNTMLEFLQEGESAMNAAMQIETEIKKGNKKIIPVPVSAGNVLAPVPHPTSCRDGYAFRQHVAAARRNRKVPMIPEFDQYPIFYFTNHNAVQGPGDIFCMPDHFQKLDFELEASIVIGKKGRNVRAKDADKYIAGYMIMNDMSARTLQMEEMLLNLGPAKGKDFSTVIGPWLVTPDELEPYRVNAKPGHIGNSYDLNMRCWVNEVLVSEGNMKDMDWTFAEIIERCSYGADILPGDVIGSGTVGTGCFLELNGTGLLNDPDYKVQWLKEGDVVEMEISLLGRLKNTIRKEDSDFSILSLKKMPEEA
ncbi:MAG: fumarylacetoacetate hydrolase family protein [Bacteroidetes bacterium]|nr:MAG: fumarylacetoacetate hydrolase family protein [Bacteroidota bacterium]REK07006.1 MAG: fumarylacetoacetate hydrolase family protein [Bacteroidota bacterium]REK33647.1 MAG: fumarylacetoacetate hydrolase family protein [Bacteroidota bacterium]REK48633.1 MAG: fumarylacetoacetate hydrolase family protein [Bacteroidota bacterium]